MTQNWKCSCKVLICRGKPNHSCSIFEDNYQRFRDQFLKNPGRGPKWCPRHWCRYDLKPSNSIGLDKDMHLPQFILFVSGCHDSDEVILLRTNPSATLEVESQSSVSSIKLDSLEGEGLHLKGIIITFQITFFCSFQNHGQGFYEVPA